MRKTAFCLICFLAITACTNTPERSNAFAKKEWLELTCSGFKTWHDCRQQAQLACPKGYYIADSLENLLIQRRVVSIACKD
jgi:hypothetical protein